jgi:redox-sensitive bicupin YhaK (pirin superfamily)
MRPRYQEIPSARIPLARSEDGRVRVKVIAGESLGAKAVIDTRTPILYLHATLEPGGRLLQPVPADFNLFAYLVAGEGVFGPEERPAVAGQMVVFASDGPSVAVAVPAKAPGPLSVLLIGGVPLNEPIARMGPFVMNTPGEIRQAIVDFQSGRMGSIPADGTH